MTKLQKIAISVCALGLVGVQVNAFELPYGVNHKVVEVSTKSSKKADIEAIKAMINELENKIKNLPEEIKKIKEDIAKIENDLNEVDGVINTHLAVNKECSNPMLNEFARNICDRYSVVSQDEILKKHKTKVENLLKIVNAKRDELIGEKENIPLMEKVMDSLIAQYELMKTKTFN